MFIFFITILVIMIPSVTFLWHAHQKAVMEQAYIRANTIYSIINLAWVWAIENSNDVKSIPAIAAKEIERFANKDVGFRFRISNVAPINQENTLNPFEIEALKRFRDGSVEYSEVASNDNISRAYLYAAPFYLSKRCEGCHFADNINSENKVYGVISVMVMLDDIEKSINKSGHASLYVIVVGLFSIAITLSVIIYWLIVRHIKTLCAAAEVIRQGGRVNINLKTDDELQDLSEAFDRMSSQIAQNEDNLKVKLDEAVQRYVDLVEELKVKNESLDNINKIKTEILDSVSHEVRTPLTKIYAYSELLCDNRVINDNQLRTKFANSLKLNINSLKNLFTDVLTLSRMDHDQYDFMMLDINLKKMVQELLSLYEIDIRAKSLNVNVNIDDNDVIYMDNESFYSAISNLISNAVKYSKQGGNINISAYSDDEKYYIVVEDFGVGIPPADIAKATKRFYRGSNVRKEFSGTGLGLCIVESIVTAHKGTINIESEVNSFTKVTLAFPISITICLKDTETVYD